LARPPPGSASGDLRCQIQGENSDVDHPGRVVVCGFRIQVCGLWFVALVVLRLTDFSLSGLEGERCFKGPRVGAHGVGPRRSRRGTTWRRRVDLLPLPLVLV